MSTRLPWIKLWDSWYTTPSHLELDALALHVGPRLLCLASASPKRGWILNAKRDAFEIKTLALSCRITVKKMRGVIEQLKGCGTLAEDDEKRLYFPAFESYQETPQAGRMRRHRDRHSDGHSDAVSDGSVTVEVRGKRKEVRGKRSDLILEEEHEAEHMLTALLDWWRFASPPDWCQAPRRTGRLASRFHEVIRLAVAHSPDASSPLEAVQRYVERAWGNAWLAQQRLGGGWLLGIDAKAADSTELEERIVRVLDGVGASPREVIAPGKPRTQAQQGYDEYERLLKEEAAQARGALRLAGGEA